MTLLQRITSFISAVGADIKAIYGRVLPPGGTAGQVLTKNGPTDYDATWQTPAATGAQINDSAASNTQTDSSNKIVSVANTAAANAAAQVKTEILGGASAAYDTLKELQDQLISDDSDISGLLTAVGNKVSFDTAQTLTEPQKAQARANIGALSTIEIGTPDTDLVALYTAAKA